MSDEKDNSVSRRDLFHILGTAPALAAVTAGAALGQTHDHAAMAAVAGTASGPYQRKVFDEHQWQTVKVLCDLIIPADERSGSASQAGVPEFIDDWLDFRKQEDGNANLTATIVGGLMWLDRESMALAAKNFREASAAQQKQILDRVAWPAKAAPEDAAWVHFFNRFRDLTASGFASSKMGVADLPYLGNRAVAEWKGCDPEVWAVLESRMKNGYKGLGGEVKPWSD
jgi:gluconate 2-dehydrogenase gamma chain